MSTFSRAKERSSLLHVSRFTLHSFEKEAENDELDPVTNYSIGIIAVVAFIIIVVDFSLEQRREMNSRLNRAHRRLVLQLDISLQPYRRELSRDLLRCVTAEI